jgi:hypothetical protein
LRRSLSKSPRRRILHTLLGAGLCLAHTEIAQGEPPEKLSVTWDAPASCPDLRRVRAAIAAALGASTREQNLSPLAASGTVTEGEGRFRLLIRLRSTGASETKSLEAATCETLADAFALVVAFTFDPSAGHRPPPTVDAPEPSNATPVASPRAPPPAPAEGAGARLMAGPLIALGAGALPFPAYGVGARVAVETGPRWELAGMFWPEQPASVPAQPSRTVGADVWLATVQPSACLSFARGAVASCAGGELGAMQARSTGVPLAGSGTSWWLALTAGVSLRAAITRGISLRLRLDAGVPFFRPRFILEDVGTAGSVQAFRPGPVYGLVSFEPEFQLFSTDRREPRHVSY